MSFPRRSFSNADVRECLRLSPMEDNILDTTFCAQMKRAVRHNHNSICEWGIDTGFRVNAWVGTIRAKAVGPYLLPERLTARQFWDFLENDTLGLQVLPLAVRQIWRQHAAGPVHYGEDVQNCPNRTYLGVEELTVLRLSIDLTPTKMFMFRLRNRHVYSVASRTVENSVTRLQAAVTSVGINIRRCVGKKMSDSLPPALK
jgi:hypothetical protein